MRALIQRVKRASVQVEGSQVAAIGQGLLTLLGVEASDTEATCERVVNKILKLRIFEDQGRKMNLSLQDIRGEHLLVSQFTLLGDLSKGNRPSFLAAGSPDHARRLFDHAVQVSRNSGLVTGAGVFAADMSVELLNDGPATFWIEEREPQ